MFSFTLLALCQIGPLLITPPPPLQPGEISVGHSNGLLEVWDIKTRHLNFSLHSHKTTITDIAYSTINGMLLVTASKYHVITQLANHVIN